MYSFSPGTIRYDQLSKSRDKIGFININISSSVFTGYENSLYTECESFLSGSPIHYNVNKEKNPTFTLTSQKKIENDTKLALLANDTYIYNKKGGINDCTKNDDYI